METEKVKKVEAEVGDVRNVSHHPGAVRYWDEYIECRACGLKGWVRKSNYGGEASMPLAFQA